METQQVTTCFTIVFTEDQYLHAKNYVEDMKKHPKRVYWIGKQDKTDEQLVMEQIAHRILSGFYHDDAFRAGLHIKGMSSALTA